MPAKPSRRREDRSSKVNQAAARAVIHHPWLTWGTLASIVAVIGGLGAGALWMADWLGDHVQTVAASKIADDKARAELAAHQVNDSRTFAWSSVQAVKNEMVALRNRVNDCNIQKEKVKAMTTLERAACFQYQQEFDDAVRRFEAARIAAVATTKEK